MQYRYEIEHAPANLDSAEGGAVLIDEARSEAVWGYKWGTLSLASPLRREGLYSLMKHALKQYRYEIEHAPANLALTEQWFC